MTSGEIRDRYLKFFEARGHKMIPAAPLVLANDPTTLFTSSGMQPLVPYLLGQPHPAGKRLVDSQPCFRAQDIEEVGDNRHTTFFEMLGNWSLGDYFKQEQLTWFFEFLTNKDRGLGLDPDKLYVSVFSGNEDFKVLSKSIEQELLDDLESVDIWKRIFKKVGIDAGVANIATKTKPDIKNGRIFYYGVEKNWWSRSGAPQQMPLREMGGPDSEVFYDFGEKWGLHERSQWKNEPCHPNCDCGRFLEIGNSVFMQYKKIDSNLFEELPNKNVDFGGGLERLAAATEDDPDIFQTDLFAPTIKTLEAITKTDLNYLSNPKPYRIIAYSLKATIFIVAEGVVPSNKQQGYMLRRLIRRTMLYARELGMSGDEWLSNSLPHIIQPYIRIYPLLNQNVEEISQTLTQEVDRFRKTIDHGLKEFEKYVNIGEVGKPETIKKILDPKSIFDLYQTYGFPYELTKEEAEKRGIEIPSIDEFKDEFEKHRQLSRTASKGMFKGGLANQSEAVTKLHTATHLLHAALRQILGSHVRQEGSNITAERLRFDFSHPKAVIAEEIRAVENLVNAKVKENLPVVKTIEDKNAALASGAVAFFREKYGDKVSVYTIGNFSRELCGGPHVTSTGAIGSVKIDKVQAIGSGRKRIYATVCPIDQV